MAVKAIIFDLDDTLYDCTNTLVVPARKRAIKGMIQKGLKTSFEEAYKELGKNLETGKPKTEIFEKIMEKFGPQNREIIKAAIEEYNNEEIGPIKLFSDVKETLKELEDKSKLILVTTGNKKRQQKKIEILGLNEYFDLIVIDDEEDNLTKEDRFLAVMMNYKFSPEEIMVVGDRINSEIKIGNSLGMITIQMLTGAHSKLIPKKEEEFPDHRIIMISETKKIFENLNNQKQEKIVAIGGGTGLPSVLEGMKKYTPNLTAVVGITDSGRSSGMLRKDFDMAPPGDIRNCLVALSDSEKLMSDLFQYRFNEGKLEGHSFGNLLITVLMKITGSFEKALKEVAKILKIRGKVLPSSHANVHIHAEFIDGTIIKEENNILDRFNKEIHQRPKIKKVFLSKEVESCKEAEKKILEADKIILGPGGLYTSVITNFLVPGIKEAIINSKAKKIYVCNIMTQPGQTYQYTAEEHAKEIEKYLEKDILDYIIVNNKSPVEKLMKIYEKEKARMVELDLEKLKIFRAEIIQENIIEDIEEIEVLWNKKNLLRHDPKKVAKIINEIE